MAYELYADGQNHFAQVYFQATAFTGPFYVGLGTGAIPAGREKTLANVVEVTGIGYARIAVARDGTSSGWTVADNVATSPVLTFTNTDVSSSWADADYGFLTLSPNALTAPAILIATVELGRTFILGPNSSEQFRFKFAIA